MAGGPASYYGAPCGGNYRVGQQQVPAVGACGPQVGNIGGYAPAGRRYLGSPEERLLGSPEEYYYGTPHVGQHGGHGGGGHGHGGGHGGGHLGGRGFGWGNWGWPWAFGALGYGLGYGAGSWDWERPYGENSRCVFNQSLQRWICYVWTGTNWVVVG